MVIITDTFDMDYYTVCDNCFGNYYTELDFYPKWRWCGIRLDKSHGNNNRTKRAI